MKNFPSISSIEVLLSNTIWNILEESFKFYAISRICQSSKEPKNNGQLPKRILPRNTCLSLWKVPLASDFWWNLFSFFSIKHLYFFKKTLVTWAKSSKGCADFMAKFKSFEQTHLLQNICHLTVTKKVILSQNIS